MREPPPPLQRPSLFPLLLLLAASLLGVAHAGAATAAAARENAEDEQTLRQFAQSLREREPPRTNADADATANAIPHQALIQWLEQQNARSGGIRAAEREVRRTLNQIHRDRTRELNRAEDLLELLGKRRASLHAELSSYELTLPSAIRRYREFIPVPRAMEIMPLFAEPAELKTRAPGSPSPTLDGASEIPIGNLSAESDLDGQDVAELDANGLLGRISADLIAIEHLLIMRDEESQAENRRHRQALEKLAAIVKTVSARARENGSRGAPSR